MPAYGHLDRIKCIKLCGQVDDCVFIDNWYYCRGDVEVVDGFIQLEISAPHLAADRASEFEVAMRRSLASIAGNGLTLDAIKASISLPPTPGAAPERRLAQLTVDASIFLISPNLSIGEVAQSFSAYSSEQFSLLYISALEELSVDVSAIGVSVSDFSIPASPERAAP